MTETADYAKGGGAAAHATSHQDGGTDEISVVGLSGVLADPQPSSWVLVSGKPDSFAPAAHKTSHQDGGTDEISVQALSGQLADSQKSTWELVSGKPTSFTPAAHTTTHASDGSDPIAFDNLAEGATYGKVAKAQLAAGGVIAKTTQDTFQVGTDGPKIKKASTVLEVRDKDDAAYAPLKALSVQPTANNDGDDGVCSPILYGTGDNPPAGSYPDGTVYFKYTA